MKVKLLFITVACMCVHALTHAQTNTWTWEGGSSTRNQTGTYGTQGTASTSNWPGSRYGYGSWVDASGDFWIFGGNGYGASGSGRLGDLWKWNGSKWTWMSGYNSPNQFSVYGTQGTAASTNLPSCRSFPLTWIDASGNFWMFGGDGYVSSGNPGYINDMWMYSPTSGEWTWEGGGTSIAQGGTYGTQGTASSSNVPGSRSNSNAWTDASGNLWLLGGVAYDKTATQTDMNDLWKYSTSTKQWTWVGGSSTGRPAGVYGTKGTAASSNWPGGRIGSTCWTDASGNFWIFGGSEADSTGTFGVINDMWMYNHTTGYWTWESGDNICQQSGVYGTQGTAASTNKPGSRRTSHGLMDASGNFWIFGGNGYDGSGNSTNLSDVWMYNAATKQWTWEGGNTGDNQSGVYGTKGTAASSNLPGARSYDWGWRDASGNFWMFGGTGYDASTTGNLNDMWKYIPVGSCSPTTSTTNISVCSSALPYSWNSTNYNTGGSYTIHLTNKGGCDSAATLVLTVNTAVTPAISITPATSVSTCSGTAVNFSIASQSNQGALPTYQWLKGTTVVSTGTTYSDAGSTGGSITCVLTSSTTCVTSSTATSTATVLSIKQPTQSITTASVNTGQTYTFNGHNYTTAGNDTVHLTNKAGCDSAAILQLSVIITRYYVTPGGAGTKSGSSWGNAMDSVAFRTNISTVAYGDTVWVAAGTYHPDLSNDSNKFVIPSGVKVYGGFAGTETALSQRNYHTNITALDGHSAIHNIVYFNQVDSTTTLDGFMVCNGYNPASGVSLKLESGAGILNYGGTSGSSNPIITNDSFVNNKAYYGGALCNYAANGGKTHSYISHCTFTNNHAAYEGGAILNDGGSGTYSPVITDCIFSGNSAGTYTGALLNSGTDPSFQPAITNCVFINNTALFVAAVYDQNCSAAYTNCTFSSNTPTYASFGAICAQNSTPTYANCIIWDNNTTNEIKNVSSTPTVSNSDIYGGWTGTGSNNINSNPLFVSTTNLQLTSLSPCINTGSNAAVPTGITTDLTGNTRVQQGIVDMGAYESPYAPVITRYYVTPGGAGTKKGTSWANALDSVAFRSALSAASYHDTFWVAAGTYQPDLSNPTDSFFIPSGVAVYGGFNGTETSFSQRNVTTNVTTLSGDNLVYHVVYFNNADNTTVLDGVTVTKGNASANSSDCFGAGIYNYNGSPVIANCIFIHNVARIFGGAIYNNGTMHKHANPTIYNCTFTYNQAYAAAGINNDGSDNGTSTAVITNCSFTHNSAIGYTGGALYNNGSNGGVSNTIVTNCVFAYDSSFQGGAVCNDASISGHCVPTYTNCTFTHNFASQYGGAMFNYAGSTGVCTPAITNCIFWNDICGSYPEVYDYDVDAVATLNYCDYYDNTTGAWAGAGSHNIISNPAFVNAAANNFQLQSCSAALNAGTATGAPSTDIIGNPRPAIGGYDIGAYELQTITSTPTRKYVNASATGANTGISWADAYTDLQSAFMPCLADTVWVAAGTYYPAATDVTVPFSIPAGMVVYGGFNGTETTVSQRNVTANPTMLSGDLLKNDSVQYNISDNLIGDNTRSDNSYHVVVIVAGAGSVVDSHTVLDGFTISGGNAIGGGYYLNEIPQYAGGGLYLYAQGTTASPTISNCTFVNNSATNNGGSVYNDGANGGSVSPVYTNCTFNYGAVFNYGGAMYNDASGGSATVVLNKCTFTHNNSDYNAGAVFSDGTSGYALNTISNTVFADNTSTYNGGGIYSQYSASAIYNSTFYGNTVMYSDGSAIYSDNLTTYKNCILWGNGDNGTGGNSVYFGSNSFTYCIGQDLNNTAPNANNIINVDPLFTNAGSGNYTLSPLSGAINKGDTTGISAIIGTTDLAGNARVQQGKIDIGAYESPYIPITHFYVTKGGAGTKSGKSWTNAIDSVIFRNYLPSAAYGDTFWVAAGTYHPNLSNPNYTFNVPSGVKLYGGFAGTETALSQRNYHTKVTILDGFTTQYNVVYFNSADSTTVLDGFAIANGYAPSSAANGAGGGIFNSEGSPVIANDSFVNNGGSGNGGAIYNQGVGGKANPTITQCVFNNNQNEFGGAIANDGSNGISSPVITNCVFMNNVGGGAAGAIYNIAYGGVSSPAIINCVFINNTTAYYGSGAAIYNEATGGISNPVITNCTFIGNMSGDSSIIYNDGATPTIINSILWDNATGEVSDNNGSASVVSYSEVKSNWTGTGSHNITGNPHFVSNTNVQLTALSPCINAGSNVAVPSGITTDLAGNARIQQGIVDLGAYESSYTPITRLYVTPGGAGTKTGISWANALDSIGFRNTLSAANYHDTFWVAAGTYQPDVSMPGDSFYVPSGVAIYGGFAGNETTFSQRNIKTNVTTLSGDNLVYHVIFLNNADSSTVLDGITVSGGNASASYVDCYGGGIYNNNGSPTIANCTFTHNVARIFGGAMYNNGTSGSKANPTIYNCTFTRNQAFAAAGIDNDGSSGGTSSAVITNCYFTHNSAIDYTGGAIYNNGSSGGVSNSVITNCVFAYDSSYQGGAVCNDGSSSGLSAPVYTNCTFTGNYATLYGGAMFNDGTSSGVTTPTITNCIFWNDVAGSSDEILDLNGAASTLNYSDYYDNGTGAWSGAGTNNIQGNPLFINAAADNFIVLSCSPTLLTATATGAPSNDIIGNPRPAAGGYDMGAYELQVIVPTPTRKYVNAHATGANTGTSWTDAYTDLQSAFMPCKADTIWVAAGDYTPSISDPSVSYNIPSGMAIYGGFAGTETSLTQRNVQFNTTILDGHNTNMVVNFDHVDSTTILDGFTISNGANTSTGYGGAIYINGTTSGSSNPRISHCTITNNTTSYGAGIFIDGSIGGSAIVSITNCIISNNTATSDGAGIYAFGYAGYCKYTITNCTFQKDITTGAYGGAIYDDAQAGTTYLTAINSVFIQDSAAEGAAIYAEGGSNPVITNCTFSGNTAGYDGTTINDQPGTAIITNCIMADITSPEIFNNNGSSTVTYSDISGGWTGTGNNNISSNPQFISNTNVQLTSSSPCINTGNNAAIPAGITTDIAGNARIQKGTVDMGAYESSYNQAVPITHYYVTPGGAGAKSGASWANAMDSVAFRNTLPTAAYHDTFWVAAGKYHPDLSSAANSFVIPSGVKVYGGFAGTETTFSQRNIHANHTILDGANLINSIVYFNTVDSTTLLDGFTVSNGNGIQGAAIYNRAINANSRPILSNDSFVNNYASANGGAIYNYNYQGITYPTITGCSFVNNTTDGWGAAIDFDGVGTGSYNPVITNCLFANNTCVGYGGAIYAASFVHNLTIVNSTFTHNASRPYNQGIVSVLGTTTMTNCVMWDTLYNEIIYPGGTLTVNNSDIRGGWTGAGANNVNKIPKFISPTNFGLTKGSICINLGSNAAIPAGITTDLLGNARIQQGVVDMGAYESPFTPCIATASIVNASICPSTSYSFHGKIFTTAGAHYDTLTNAGGCDSVVTVNITFKNITTSTTPVSICPSALPYNWNGNNYNTAGRDTVHLTNKAGCDSITILVLTLKQTSTSTTNISICSNALPYNWNGNNYNIAGHDTVHLTNKAGCDSVTILVLTVNTPVTPAISISPNPTAATCSGTPITFSIASQSNQGTVPTYKWYKGTTQVSTAATYVDAGTTGGSITCVLTSNVSCVTSATATSTATILTITTPVTPTVHITITPDSLIVPATTVKFTANITNGGTTPHYQWKKNGVNITGATGGTYSTNGLVNADAITCVLTSNATCVTTTTATSNKITMTVNSTPCPTVIANPTPLVAQVCSGGSVPFSIASIAANAVYKWQYTTGAETTVDSLWKNFGTNSTSATLSGATQKTYARVVVKLPGCATVSSPTALVNIDSVALNATATNVTASSALLSWNSINGATYSITINGHTYASGTNSYTVTGLSACHSYTATITATGGTCGGTPTGSVNLTTPPAAIALTLTAGTGGTLVASWNAGVGPYKLYYGQETAQQNLTLVNVASGTTTYTIPAKNVASGASYMAYVVDAGSTCTPIAQSKYAYYGTAGGSCTGTAPVIVSPASTATTFTINWTGAAAAYQVYYKNTSGNWVSYSTSANTFTITGASPNTCYPYYVVNKCGTTFGLSSPVDTVCTPAECAAPLNLVLSQPTCKGFTATWNTAAGAANYQVYCAITTGVGTPTWNVSYASSNAVTFTTFGQGTPVAVYVEGNCTVGGRSIASNIETMTTLSVGCKDDNNNITSSTNTNAFSVYPNPNTGTFKVLMNTLSINATATLEVMDVLGRLVYSTDVVNNNGTINESIDLGNMVSNGIYMVRVRCGNDTHIAKVEVQR